MLQPRGTRRARRGAREPDETTSSAEHREQRTSPVGASSQGMTVDTQTAVQQINHQMTQFSIAPEINRGGKPVSAAAHPVEPQSVPTSSVFGSVYNRNYDPSQYKQRARKFYERPGRVIVVMWSEPADDGSRSTMHITPGPYGFVHQKPRFFIVLRAYEQHAWAVGIKTYGRRGTAHMPQRLQSTHGIAYQNLADRYPLPGETALQPYPIRIATDSPTESLAPVSRINYSKTYTIEYNIAVRAFGVVTPESVQPLTRQWFTSNQLAPASVQQNTPYTLPETVVATAGAAAGGAASSSTQTASRAVLLSPDGLRAFHHRLITQGGLSPEQSASQIRAMLSAGRIQITFDENRTGVDTDGGPQVAGELGTSEDDNDDEDDEETDDADEDEDEDDSDETA